ncbi:penicillin-binding protein [Candidatus Shapirobacteria bacterium CG10_big_fil_rev_8_21_14_0_10_48_15]|uniref:Penicillin-binding protein n=1 Tax=Candidatus Shapirobacteria bacterium CG10_big_fil_rev_8_21_14_0_10_48_15 TaxID=1974484 RepID=A0A2M8L7K9_9BACT|nr:MAG: penicillin-binding protein [Candidatus Shapirobacteria bacterium CG10_big_fil_rev_8_21_14_0_10_48_15]
MLDRKIFLMKEFPKNHLLNYNITTVPQRSKRKHVLIINRAVWRLPQIKFLALVLLAGGLLVFFYLFQGLPSPTRLNSDVFPASTLIFDRQGRLLYEIYAEKNRVPIKLADLPDYVKWATIASEDKNFYQHHGFDFRGIARAFYNTLFHRSLQGGSTITQQLVKNALLTPQRTVRRKIREAMLTLATEAIYSKDEILEMYLNQAPYGGTAWGIESAAQTYFNQPARGLSLAQAALLAGLPASPTRFSPFGAHPELAKERQERVLEQMMASGYLDRDTMTQAINEELAYAPPAVSIEAPHFVLHVKEQLVEKYGEKMVEQGGLRVTTTLDLDLQNFVQQTVAVEVAKLTREKASNGAALVTNPKTGEILAMVGSRNYFDEAIDGNVNITLRPRQPGSSIKPINYALALEKKLITLSTVINDVPTCFNVTGQKTYCPVNYDNQFHGPVQVRFALGNSYNVPAVKILALNGLENFIDQATQMGITTFKDPAAYGLSITLGGGEVTMHDLAQAYSVFANAGIRQDLWSIQKIVDHQGKIIAERPADSEGPRVLSMEAAYLINHTLLDSNARSAAFGPSSWLNIKNHPEVSVKTGTTNDLRDNWTIGWTPSAMVVTWVGNNDNSPMSYIASGTTGAAPIWNKIITAVLKDRQQEWPLKPEGVIGTQVCRLSGQSPHPDAPCETRFEYFIEDTLPEAESLVQFIEIDKTTGQLATGQTLPENRETQPHPAITDPLGISFCLDCPFPTGYTAIRPANLTPNLSP